MRLLPIKDVMAAVSLSRAQIWRLQNAGEFPKSVQVTPGRVAWVEAEIDRWVRDRIAARDQEAA
jgi:prophage regulatory protein